MNQRETDIAISGATEWHYTPGAAFADGAAYARKQLAERLRQIRDTRSTFKWKAQQLSELIRELEGEP